MEILNDLFGRSIRLTDERRSHLETSHPELREHIGSLGETLLSPDRIVKSITDEDVELFYRFYRGARVGDKYLCVVVKSNDDDRFMLTAYFTDSIKSGEVLWQRQ